MSAPADLSERSALVAALGSRASALRPEVRRYVEGAGEGIGVCEGVFDIAGSRLRKLNLLARPFVGPDLLVTRYERAVPFRVVNRLAVASDSAVGLRAERSFRFRAATERLVDVLSPEPTPGVLRDLLGRRARVELRLRCDVTGVGHLRLRSERVWIRFGGLRIRLLGPLGLRVEVEDGYEEATGRQTIRARVRNPVLGTVLEYRGSFTYRIEADAGDEMVRRSSVTDHAREPREQT